MKEWILIIVILTSNGLVETEVKDYDKPREVLTKNGWEQKESRRTLKACQYYANKIGTNCHGDKFQFIHAYCKENPTGLER
jgi:hypothetical protein